ncbi:MAG: peptide deformylase [Armatimonadota bacterium]
MAVRPIVYCGDPVLRRKATRIREIDEAVLELLEDLRQTMLEASGLGLAAAQIGVPVTAIVVLHDPESDEVLKLINPRIVESEGEQDGTEACLSLPTLRGVVIRPQRVVVEAVSPRGDPIQLEGEGLMARCLAHELDHLQGRLFIDIVEPDTLCWIRPDESEEAGYRTEPTTVEEARAAFDRLRRQREGRT